ncbi:non-hydrolyzing UDP-N-acetylglucosamine 2-epimerase [Amycolatopsis sp. lyj-108]|uniref:non-hydrolyzing UDP-N-acetylglucosamine 2-epimerase n=1 Tax=Amycolatopsis sp. lyj-108 TaxID=2789286 RepID=UPI00397CF104
MKPEVHLVAGTRPEAVKLAPVALAMLRKGRMRPVIVASGQHPELVRQALSAFDLKPDEELDCPRATGGQAELYGNLLPELDRLWSFRPPTAVVVQGDTATALGATLVAFWGRIPIAHLEAGLRSADVRSPFPEEANRRLISLLANLHLAPTERAARALVTECVEPDKVLVIGNTVVDAQLAVARANRPFLEERLSAVEARTKSGARRLILFTMHRRESWGEPMAAVLRAVRTLLRRYSDVEVVLPAHPNPRVRSVVETAFEDEPRVLVTGPLDYSDLIRLLRVCALVLSDSGGIQEEAPTFGVPVVVLREVTERAEGIESGCAVLAGTDEDQVLRLAGEILDGSVPTAAANPYGDGHAAGRAEQALAWMMGLSLDQSHRFVACHAVVR